MAGIEEVVSSPLKKLPKNKKVFIFVGVGVVAGVVALLMKKSRGAEKESIGYGEVSEEDQTVIALGSQLQAFQSDIAAQMEATNQALADFQTTTAESNASIVAEILALEQAQADAAPVYNPIAPEVVPEEEIPPVVPPSTGNSPNPNSPNPTANTTGPAYDAYMNGTGSYEAMREEALGAGQ
jgi:hypothetical protein